VEARSGRGRRFHRAKDQAIFEKDEVLTQAGRPYTVFTPYRTRGLRTLDDFYVEAYRSRRTRARSRRARSPRRADARALGFERTNLSDSPSAPACRAPRGCSAISGRIDATAGARLPRGEGRVVPLGAQPLRHDLGARAGARRALTQGRGAATWLSELVWRDFFFQILWHFPRVAREAFHAEYARLDGPTTRALRRVARGAHRLPARGRRDAPDHQTGYMHNRLRMVAASFLAKDLLVDWRLGERYFAAAPERLRPRGQQRRLAMGGVHGLRRAALLPHLQPGDAVGEVRSRGRFIRRYLPELAQRGRRVHPRALDDAAVAQARRAASSGATIPRPWSTTPRSA
jgi:deoxyribodipyrimidine photo-lyase